MSSLILSRLQLEVWLCNAMDLVSREPEVRERIAQAIADAAQRISAEIRAIEDEPEGEARP